MFAKSAALGANAGIDDGEEHTRGQELRSPGQGQRTGPDVVGGNVVGDIDDLGVRARAPDDGLAHTDEQSSCRVPPAVRT